MAPEVFLPERQPPEATLELLKAVDSWAYGMVLFILANASLRYPYQEEVMKERSSNPLKDSVDSFRKILRVHLHLHQVYTEFDMTKRKCSLEYAVANLEGRLPSLCENVNLELSQISALEAHDYEVVQIASQGDSNCVLPQVPVLNDATNACVFLALKVCDALVDDSANTNIDTSYQLKSIPEIATSVLANYPAEHNKIRDISSLYTVLDANKLMRDTKHLRNNFEFTEELPYAESVFSQVSRVRLLQQLNILSSTEENFLSIYTCEPFSLLLASIERRLFVLDTHPVPEKSGGNGNALFKLYESASSACCLSLCQWLWNRLAKASNSWQSP